MIQTMAKATGLPVSSVNLTARHLREAGLITSGGRGPGGAEMAASDATNLLLGVAAAMTIKDAPDVVRTIRRAMPQKDNIATDNHDENPLKIDNVGDIDFGGLMDGIINLLIETGEPINKYTNLPVIQFHVEVDRTNTDIGSSPTLVLSDTYNGVHTEFQYLYHALGHAIYNIEPKETTLDVAKNTILKRGFGGVSISARIDDGVFYDLADLIAGRKAVDE
jgi:hypothetical protein